MAKPITNYSEGVEFLKENGKQDGHKFVLEKTSTRKFMELAGAPIPVQEAYHNAEKLLRASVTKLTSENLHKAIEAVKDTATKEELRDIKVTSSIRYDNDNYDQVGIPVKDVRTPQTGEVVTKFGVIKATVHVRHTGVTKEDIEELSSMISSIYNNAK